jgi:hypothetical protein
MANNNKQMVDLPFFELCNQAPVATSATSDICTAEDSTNRYIYYLTASTFYRYDTIADTWQQLATPNTAPVTGLSMRFTANRGYHGRVISATSTTVVIPGLRGQVLDGKTIRILHGTGAGQERTLSYVGETVHDAGVINFTSTSNISDTTKKWRTNQWSGYMVGITFNTGVTQYKKILYNDAVTLYIADTNLQPHEPWNNQTFSSASPYAVPVTTAGSQAHFQIMSSTFTVSSWTTTPDYTSYFTTLTGGIYLLSSASTAPFFTLQYYDVANDMWQTKTCPQSLIAAQFTDFTLERFARVGTAYTTNVGIVTSTNRTLQDPGQNFATNDRYANYRILINGGVGSGQSRRIVGHTTDTYTVERNWDTLPDNTSTYQIWTDFDRVFLQGGGAAALFAYSPETDAWMQGQSFDVGIANTIGATMNGWTPIGITGSTVIAAGVRAINTTPTVSGNNYAIGDVLTCSVGGTGAQVRVVSIATTTASQVGPASQLELIHSGTATGFVVGTGRATTATTGSGTGCTIEITQVGETSLVTTNTAHWFETGDAISIAGCTNVGLNTSYNILGVPFFSGSTPTSFCLSTNAGATMTSALSQTTSIFVDSTRNWIVNEHAGRLVHIMVAGTAPTSQIRWIISNTATTLTLSGSITAAVNGTSKYIIYDSKVFGIDDQRKETGMATYGYATSGTTTTLTDSTKSWIPNQWLGYNFKIETGTGYGSGRIGITSNTSNTLYFTTQTFSPNTTSKYEIADSWGLLTAGGAASTLNITETGSKNWQTNQWAGKRVRYIAGTNVSTEGAVLSNTATTITTTAAYTTDTSTVYAILSIPVRGTGIELINNFGCTNLNTKGRYLYSPRGGGSNTMDIFDITKGRWIFGYFFTPQSELFTTGSSYAYDGGNKIYMGRSTTSAPMRIFAYDMNTNTIDGAMTSTLLQGTAHIGNFMEIVEDPTGAYTYLYYLQNTGTLLSRALIF